MTRSNEASPRLAIVLPTYNGESYLAAQLDSLLQQDYPDFVIVARDDGSTDGSQAILQRYAKEHPSRFHLLATMGGNLGASGSFSCLLEYVLEHKDALGLEAAYVMCSDQDDVWHPAKISKTMQAMLALESAHPQRACLVHGDLRVVDAQGRVIAESFFAYQDIRPHRHGFARMLVSNSVTGCTALLNETLARLATPIPPDAVMHDWWFALLAAACGHIHSIDEALLDYRQHASNTLGAQPYRPSGFSFAKLRSLGDPQYDALTDALYRQAAAFAGRHHDALSNRAIFTLSIALWMGSTKRILRNAVFYVLRKGGMR